MGVTAFAATTTYTKFHDKSSLQDGYNTYYKLTGTAKEVKNQVVDLGDVMPSDKKVVYIGLYDTMFADKNNTQGGSVNGATPTTSTLLRCV